MTKEESEKALAAVQFLEQTEQQLWAELAAGTSQSATLREELAALRKQNAVEKHASQAEFVEVTELHARAWELLNTERASLEGKLESSMLEAAALRKESSTLRQMLSDSDECLKVCTPG